MIPLAVTIQVLLASLVFLGPIEAGEVYTWTDAQGNVHITDRPPENGSPAESVVPYSNRPETETRPVADAQQPRAESRKVGQLNKHLKRLKEREIQLQQIVDENKASIAAAEKDADYYSRRSGSYARRNQKAVQRQLLGLNNNLTTYQSDLLYVREDIAETEERLKSIEAASNRTDGEPQNSGSPKRGD